LRVGEDAELVSDAGRKLPVYQCAEPVLPSSVVRRPKQPFLLPIAGMLRPGHAIFEFLMDRLHSDCRTLEFLQRDVLMKWVNANVESPMSALGNAIWAWLVFDVWAEVHSVRFR